MKVDFESISTVSDRSGPFSSAAAVFRVLLKGGSKSRTAIYRLYLMIYRAARDACAAVSVIRDNAPECVNDHIEIPYKDRTVSIRQSSIIAVTSDDHYVELHTYKESLRLHAGYSSICALLDPEQFIEINRGVMLNMARISHRQKDLYVMKNGESFAIRANKRKPITGRIEAFRLKNA